MYFEENRTLTMVVTEILYTLCIVHCLLSGLYNSIGLYVRPSVCVYAFLSLRLPLFQQGIAA